MRFFRHMVRGELLNTSCPVVDVLHPLYGIVYLLFSEGR